MGFKKCLMGSFNLFKWVPVLFIVTVAVWSYYAYVIQLCLLSVENTAQQVFYLFFYHVVLFMFVWSYWQTIFAPVGRVPREFRLTPEVLDAFERAETQEQQKQILENFSTELPVVTRTLMGVRFCEKCRHIKPDRAHHCSVCGACVLKMDHHCPWVNNCVGYSNYKYFVLFLGYAAFYCIYVSLTSMPFFVAFWKNELEAGPGKFHILFLFFVATMFFISLSSLFSYHIYLLLLNRSTLESFRPPVFRLGPDKNGFNLGKFNNFAEVFGDDKRLWFLPVFSSKSDGVEFRVRSPSLTLGYDAVGITVIPVQEKPASLGDGVSFPQRSAEEEESNLLRNGHRTSSQELEGNSLYNLTPQMRNGNTRNPGFSSVLIEPV